MSANKRIRQIEKIVLDAFYTPISNLVDFTKTLRSKDDLTITFNNSSDNYLSSITITDNAMDWCASYVTVTTGLLQENGDFILLESGDFILQE